MIQKERLDQFIFKQNKHEKISHIQSLIMQGYVFVNDQKETKGGRLVSSKDIVELRYEQAKYVSRSGYKLAGAFLKFQLSCAHQHCLDIGQSTGGFTDFLIQNNAKHVLGIDVAYGKINPSIRNAPNVTVLERQNARYVKIPNPHSIDLVVMDVSFISVVTILENIVPQLRLSTHYVVLIKPQFEIEKSKLPKGGILNDTTLIRETLAKTKQKLTQIGLTYQGKCKAPLKGTKGNQEYFFWLLPASLTHRT